MRELRDKEQTGREMYDLATTYADDIDQFVDAQTGKPLSEIPLAQYYSIIRSIPFRKDTHGVEVVTRPYHLFTAPWQGWDCKKKGIALAAYLAKNGIPFRFVSVSRRPDGAIHHVLIQAMVDGEWRDVDATYPHNELFEHQTWTAAEVLPAPGPETLSGAPVLISMYGVGEPSEELAGEFNDKAVEMGALAAGAIAGIVAAIMGLVGGVTAAIVSAVSATRRQEREHQFQMRYLAEQEAVQTQAQEKAIAAQKEAAAATVPAWQKWILPAGLAAGAALLLGGDAV